MTAKMDLRIFFSSLTSFLHTVSAYPLIHRAPSLLVCSVVFMLARFNRSPRQPDSARTLVKYFGVFVFLPLLIAVTDTSVLTMRVYHSGCQEHPLDICTGCKGHLGGLVPVPERSRVGTRALLEVVTGRCTVAL